MSEQLIVIGWSHKNAPVKFRDKLFLSKDEIQCLVKESVQPDFIQELTILSTCNRTEFYFISSDTSSLIKWVKDKYNAILKRNIDFADGEPYTQQGSETIKHLFRVASGMESMMLGENQILSQVKTAHEHLLMSSGKTPLLNQLFRDAVSCGKAVRTDTDLCRGAVSISLAAVELAKRIYSSFQKQKILLVGAGESAELTAKHFQENGAAQFVIVNRSEERGKRLAEKFSAEYAELSEIPELLKQVDIVVAATHSKEYLLTSQQVNQALNARQYKNLLMIDISTPRNIDTDIHKIQEVFLYDIDHLENVITENLEKRKGEIPTAELKKLILLLIIQLLINGCAVVGKVIAKTIQPRMEKAKDITEGCKTECVTFTKYSDEWCDCMNQCNQDELNKINLDMTIHIEECP